MRVILAILLVATQLACATPPPPSAEDVGKWIGFSRPVSLVAKPITRGDYFKWGKPIWVTAYQAPKEALVSYVIAVYERDSLWAGEHPKLEEEISNRAKEVEGRDDSKYTRVETRPDGRKVFFSVMGFGPGGTVIGGFTSFPDCELVVMQMFDHQDDTPDDQRLKDSAKPTNELPTIFRQVEQFIQSAK